MFSMIVILLFFDALQVFAIKMDAAVFDVHQNKSIFYSNARYFVFTHDSWGSFLSEEGSVINSKSWLPTPVDAAHKPKKALARTSLNEVVIVGDKKYSIEENNKGVLKLNEAVRNLVYGKRVPDAVAQFAENAERFYFKGNGCRRLNNSGSKLSEERPITDYFKNATYDIDAALIIKRQLFILKGEHVWSWIVHQMPAELLAGYPKLFKDVFYGIDSQPAIFTSMKYVSRRFVGHTIIEVEVQSLEECLQECLDLPFLTCSSINYKKTNERSRCEINEFKEKHFPLDLVEDEDFVYYDVNW